jgi:hypothetical protein
MENEFRRRPTLFTNMPQQLRGNGRKLFHQQFNIGSFPSKTTPAILVALDNWLQQVLK